MHAQPMMNRCATCGAEWWDAHACPKQVLKDGRTLGEWAAAAAASDGWPRLTDGARAMSDEELKRRAEQQGDGMRNAWPTCEHNRLAAQQNMNAWTRGAVDALPIAQFPPKPKRTRWQRLMDWIKA